MVSKIEKVAIREFLKTAQILEKRETGHESDQFYKIGVLNPEEAFKGLVWNAYESPEWYGKVLSNMKDEILRDVLKEHVKNYLHNLDAHGNLFLKSRDLTRKNIFGDLTDSNNYEKPWRRSYSEYSPDEDQNDVLSILKRKRKLTKSTTRKPVKKVTKKCKCK